MMTRVGFAAGMSWLLAVLLASGSAQAQSGQTFYVRAGATGAGTGANWADAYTRLPSTMVRGATYYVAAGTYTGPVTFSTPESGSTYIYIKKATATAHGTDVGWSPAYGSGVAAFSGTWTFRTGYWDIDGVTGGGPGSSPAEWPTSWTTGHGISQTVGQNGDNVLFAMPGTGGGGTITGLRFRHLKFVNGTPKNYTGTGTANVFRAENSSYHVNDVIVEYCYVTEAMTVPFHVKYSNDWTVQYCFFSSNGVGNDSNFHRELWSGISNDRWVWRWNYILNINNSAIWAFVNDGDPSMDVEIYGNIVDYDGFGQSGSAAARFIDADPGVVTNWKVFNNTVVGWDSGSPAVVLNGGSLTFRNNIYANHPSHYYGPGIDGTKSHNAVYKLYRSGTGDVTSSWASTMGQSTQVFTSDPFVNYAARDLRLKAATQPGSAAGSPAGNAVDMFGHRRGADGVWDRGALEFGVSEMAADPPGAPTNVRVQ